MKNLPLSMYIFMEKGYLSIHHHILVQERACEYLDIYILHAQLKRKNTCIHARLSLLPLSSPLRCPSQILNKYVEDGHLTYFSHLYQDEMNRSVCLSPATIEGVSSNQFRCKKWYHARPIPSICLVLSISKAGIINLPLSQKYLEIQRGKVFMTQGCYLRNSNNKVNNKVSNEFICKTCCGIAQSPGCPLFGKSWLSSPRSSNRILQKALVFYQNSVIFQ